MMSIRKSHTYDFVMVFIKWNYSVVGIATCCSIYNILNIWSFHFIAENILVPLSPRAENSSL